MPYDYDGGKTKDKIIDFLLINNGHKSQKIPTNFFEFGEPYMEDIFGMQKPVLIMFQDEN